MKSIKLAPNWWLQFTKCILAFSIIFLIHIIFSVNLKIVFLTVMPALLIVPFKILYFRFLHCYKAGICYTRLCKSVISIARKLVAYHLVRFFFSPFLMVGLDNRKTFHFYNWQLDDETQSVISRMYCNKVAKKMDNTRAC